MTYPFAIRDILEPLNGKLIFGEETNKFKTYCIDSRTSEKDTLFIPLIGTQRDGHSFILDAIEKGSSAVLIKRGHPQIPHILEVLKERKEKNGKEACFVSVIEVRHTLVALQKLASWFRKQFPKVKVFALTGSVGKTQTKEIAITLLKNKFRAVGTEKNFNNEIGVPLAIGKLSPETEVAVLEMAMRGRGEISLLSRIAEPHFTLITNTHVTHIGRLGSIEEITRAKAEIVDGILNDGVLWLNISDPNLKLLLHEVAGKPATRNGLVTQFFDVSLVEESIQKILPQNLWVDTKVSNQHHLANKKADLYVEKIEMMGTQGSKFIISDGRKSFQVALKLLGFSAVKNFLCACAICTELGLDLEECVRFTETIPYTPQRLTPYRLAPNLLLIDDTYNSGPASVREAISLLMQLPRDWKRLIVLGDMLELGKYEKLFHRQVAQLVYLLPPSKLICVGEAMRSFLEVPVPDGFEVIHFPCGTNEPQGSQNFFPKLVANPVQGEFERLASISSNHDLECADEKTIEKINQILLEEVKKNENGLVILIKASRGLHLERAVKAVLDEFNLEEKIL